MRFVKGLELGMMLAVAASGLHGQAQPARDVQAKAATAAAAANAAQSAKPAAQAPAKPAAPASTAQAKPATGGNKPRAKSPAPKTAKKAVVKPAKPATSATKDTTKAETRVARRDPFESLIGHGAAGSAPTGPLPPGKAGLQVSTLRLDGVVRAPTGMIAVVSNPQARTYFLREGDQLYDGRVEKIAMDGVSFHEVGKDAFGKPVERQVNKRIYASAGEQQ